MFDAFFVSFESLILVDCQPILLYSNLKYKMRSGFDHGRLTSWSDQIRSKGGEVAGRGIEKQSYMASGSSVFLMQAIQLVLL